MASTCSEYAVLAIEKYGVFKGGFLATKRILRCNPWGGSGVDNLPGENPVHNEQGEVKPNFKSKVLSFVTGDFNLFKIPIPTGHIWDSFLRVFLGLVAGIIIGVPLGLFMGLNRFAKGFFDPLIELYRPVPPLAWAPLVISVLGLSLIHI